MRISEVAKLAAGCLILAACGTTLGQSRNAPSRIALPDGTVVAGAEGWCIDQKTTRAAGDTAVVVLGSCAAIAGDAQLPQPEVPGVVTVSVESQPASMPDPETLQKFFVSPAGRAALAGNGNPGSVSILDTRLKGDLLYLHASDSSLTAGASNEIWRALFGMGDRFVAVSFYTRPEDSIDSDDGLATLEAQVARLRAANRR